MAIYGYTKNYKLIKPQYDTDTWHDYEYDNLDTIDAVLSAIYASGNWKGFWATNTAYVVGDVVIDRDTDTMYKVMVEHTTSEATFAAEQTAHPDYYELWSPNNLAESWAIKTDGKVSNEDYSAKAYAISSGLIDDGSAKEWAIGSGAIGTTGEYSAKKYATDAHNDYISMTSNANVVAVGSNINNVNTVGQSISNVNTVAGNVSSVNTVAGVSTDVTTVASIATAVSTVANNDANITTVATNISDVNTAATNIAAIQDAPTAASNAAQSATNAANSATASANSATASATSAQAAQDALNDVQGLIATPIGTIFQSVYVDESLDIARKLNGQLISSTKFTGFRSWLNTVQTAAPNLFTTETNWQAEKTNSKLGQCGKFVVDDTAGTIRLPCVVNAQGLVDLALIGGIKNESLPNITGNWAGVYNSVGLSGAVSGNFSTSPTYPESIPVNQTGVYSLFNIDASRSSSTYQDNAPVQQEAVQYPYYIQVATGIEETLPAIREYNINTPFFFGQSMYSDVAPDNASWLASNGQYNARSVYPDYYDWLVAQMNAGVSGFVASTATYTDYDFVVNQTDQTFRLPLLNGERVLVAKKEPTTENQSWYNLYSDGWLEQGGQNSTGAWTKVTLLKPYLDTNYTIVCGVLELDADTNICTIGTHTKTTDSFYLGQYHNGNYYGKPMWMACGYTTTPTQSDYTEINGLYYYIGDTVQDASLINAGAVLGQLATKTNSVEAAEASMPSGRYIDLTLGASGSTYTAPANGYFVVTATSTSASRAIVVFEKSHGICNGDHSYSAETGLRCFVPCQKGKSTSLIYSGVTITGLWFVYAEGDNNV